VQDDVYAIDRSAALADTETVERQLSRPRNGCVAPAGSRHQRRTEAAQLASLLLAKQHCAATARNVPTAATDNCADIASRYEADLFSSVTARSRSLLTRGSMVWGPKFTDGVAASLEIPEVL